MMLTACSSTSLLNALNRADSYRIHTGLAYGEHPRQRLDIYQPTDRPKGCVIVYVYGGSWEEGSKSKYGFVGAALARQGHTVVIPNYRLYPEVIYPAFIEDIALSLTHPVVQDRIQARPLILMGHSAGAMLAGLVSFAPQYLTDVGLAPSIVDGYIALAGPHDYFLPTDKPRWVRIFGKDKDRQRTALTVNHIGESNPPTLILHGAEDQTVTPKSAKSLAQTLQKMGSKVHTEIYRGVNHIEIIAAMSRGLSFLAPTLTDINQFLQPICNRR